MTGPRLSAIGLLNRHLRRIGADKTALADPPTAYRITVLRNLLVILEAALADEDVERATAQRVVERVIYGGSPSPTDSEERERMTARMLELVKVMPVRPEFVIPKEPSDATNA